MMPLPLWSRAAVLPVLLLVLATSGCCGPLGGRPTSRPAAPAPAASAPAQTPAATQATTKPATRPAGLVSRFEAEEQLLSGGAEIRQDLTASEGQYVQLGKKGRIRWSVEVPATGRYELKLRYRARSSDRAQFLLVNDQPRGIGFPMTAGEWGEVTTVRPLNAGPNLIELGSDWGEMDVDLLRFTVLPRNTLVPIVEYPVISPRRNAYYHGGGDLRLKLDLGGHVLNEVAAQGKTVPFESEPYRAQDDALTLRLPGKVLDTWPDGTYTLNLRFDGGTEIPFELQVADRPASAPWTIVAFNVSHGASVFMKLPGGKTALIDTGTAAAARGVVLPFLQAHGISAVDYLILTHYHDDHAGGVKVLEQSIRFGKRLDYKSFATGDSFDLEGVKVTVLNAFDGGTEENARSLCLRCEYNGFVYLHGGDTYGQNQVQMLKAFPAESLRAHVFHANHHLHGSIDVDFYRTVDPVLVLVSAEQAVYARGAFATHFKEGVERYLKAANARFREPLLTLEVGSIVVRVQDGEHWSYETASDAKGIALP